MKRLTHLIAAIIILTAASTPELAQSAPQARVLFHAPFNGNLVAVTPDRELEPISGVEMVQDLSQSVTIGEIEKGKEFAVGGDDVAATGDARVAFERGLSGQAVRLKAKITYAAEWMKKLDRGTITVWYRNPVWKVEAWMVPAMVTPAQQGRAKTSAFQTPISWWIFDRLTAPPEQGNSRWYHWTIVNNEHPRNISPREKDDGAWHLWALRWDRPAGMLEAVDDGEARDLGKYNSRLEPGKPFWVEVYRGNRTEVYEDAGHVKLDEVLLGNIILARNCEVTLDELYVWDAALSRDELRAAWQRGAAGGTTWPNAALPVPARKLTDGADMAKMDSMRPPPPPQVDWSDANAISRKSPTQESICLNGYWRFQAGADRFTPPAAKEWAYVRIPGFWLKVAKPDPIPNFIDPDKLTPKGQWKGKPIGEHEIVWLERDVTVPTPAGRCFLRYDRFDDDMTPFDLYVNGKFARQVRTYGPGRVDITSLVKPGELNRVILGVEKKNRFLFDLFLETRAAQAASFHDVYVIPEWRKKSVTVQFEVENHTAQAQSYQCSAEFAEWKTGKKVHELPAQTVTAPASRAALASLQGAWVDPHCWSVYDPFLHTVKVVVRDAKGALVDESLPVRFGYREMWGEGGWLMCNGSKLQIRGMGQSYGAVGYNTPIDYAAMQRLAYSFITTQKSFNSNWKRELNWYGADSFLEVADELGFCVSLKLHGTGYDAERLWAGNPGNQARTIALAKWLRNHPAAASYLIRQTGNYAQSGGNAISLNTGGYWWDRFHEDASWEAYIRAWDEFVAPIRQACPTAMYTCIWMPYGGDLGHYGEKLGYDVPLQTREEWPRFWAGRGMAKYVGEDGWPQISRYSYDVAGQDDLQRHYDQMWPNLNQVTEELAAMYIGDEAYDQDAVCENGFGKTWKKGADGRSRFDWEYVNRNQTVGIPYSRRFTGPYESPGYVKLRALWPYHNIRSWRSYGYGYWEHTESSEYTHGDWNAAVAKPEGAQTITNALRRPGLFIDDGKGDARAVLTAPQQVLKGIGLTEVGKVVEKAQRPLAAWVLGWPDTARKDHAFYSGETIRKNIGVFNEYPRPLTAQVRWSFSLRADAKPLTGETLDVAFAAGDEKYVPIQFTAPAAKVKTQYVLRVETLLDGKVVHDDAFNIEVFPPRKQASTSGRIGIIDTGAAGSVLQIAGIPAVPVTEKSNLADFDLLIIGRNTAPSARTRDLLGKLDVGKHLAAGLNVLIFEQEGDVVARTGTEDWFSYGLKPRSDRPEIVSYGLRQERLSARNVFIRNARHPLFAGLSNEDFANWRGASNLIAPWTEERWHGSVPGRIRRNANGSNFGDVATYVFEKPQGGNFVSLLDAEFDLLYSALVEEIRPNGRTIRCQLNVSNRCGVDPVATLMVERLVAYAQQKPAPMSAKAAMLGGPEWRKSLAHLPFDLAELAPTASADELMKCGVLFVGIGTPRIEEFDAKNASAGIEAAPGKAGQDAALTWLERNRQAVADHVAGGGTVIVLPVQGDAELTWLPFPVKLAKTKFFAARPGDFFSFGGIGPADLYWRRATELALPAGLPAGSRATVPAVFSRAPWGKGEVIFAQAHPRLFHGAWAGSKIARVFSTILTEKGVADRFDTDLTATGYQKSGFPYFAWTLYFDPFLSTDW